jgi:chemotaxis methyl-accepting protein methylase
VPQTEAVLLQKVFAQLRARTDRDFSRYKRSTVLRRVARRMQMEEAVPNRENPPRIQIFGSDLHSMSLKKAREGFYPGDIEADVSPERLKRFFQKENGGYRIRKEIRELVVFAPHNLLANPPFSHMDLISCRNLLIYLERDVQHDVIELFHCPSLGGLKPSPFRRRLERARPR